MPFRIPLTVTTGAFHYGVKRRVKECRGCSYVAAQEGSVADRRRRLGDKEGISRSTQQQQTVATNPGALVYLSERNQKPGVGGVVKFAGKKMSTSHRVITCIPRSIQTDGRRLASWKDSLRRRTEGRDRGMGGSLAPKSSGYATSSSIMFSLLSRLFQSDQRRRTPSTSPHTQRNPRKRDEQMFETSEHLRGLIRSNH